MCVFFFLLKTKERDEVTFLNPSRPQFPLPKATFLNFQLCICRNIKKKKKVVRHPNLLSFFFFTFFPTNFDSRVTLPKGNAKPKESLSGVGRVRKERERTNSTLATFLNCFLYTNSLDKEGSRFSSSPPSPTFINPIKTCKWFLLPGTDFLRINRENISRNSSFKFSIYRDFARKPIPCYGPHFPHPFLRLPNFI